MPIRNFTYIENRTHFDLYRTQTADPNSKPDPFGLFDRIAMEMYAIARPAAHWKPAEPLPSH